MEFKDFQRIVSTERLNRYLIACSLDEKKTIALYKLNIRASMEMFIIVGAFEVALRNAIDKKMKSQFGDDWLRDAVLHGGIFDVSSCECHRRIIYKVYMDLLSHNNYSHCNLLSKLEFGVWKYMFSTPQYRASGNILLGIFPDKPRSSRDYQYNHSYIYNELDHINSLRNRIAHHEPICFPTGQSRINTDYICWVYNEIKKLFSWMRIDMNEHIDNMVNIKEVCMQINRL
jgi:hypothetical protein